MNILPPLINLLKSKQHERNHNLPLLQIMCLQLAQKLRLSQIPITNISPKIVNFTIFHQKPLLMLQITIHLSHLPSLSHLHSMSTLQLFLTHPTDKEIYFLPSQSLTKSESKRLEESQELVIPLTLLLILGYTMRLKSCHLKQMISKPFRIRIMLRIATIIAVMEITVFYLKQETIMHLQIRFWFPIPSAKTLISRQHIT